MNQRVSAVVSVTYIHKNIDITILNQNLRPQQDLAYQSILIRTLTPKPGVMMCDDEVQMKEKLICYLQCVFQISNDQHQEYLRIAETAKSLSTKIYLNCKLKEMKRTGVESMDVKEYYVKWYLQSQPDLAQKGDIRKSIMMLAFAILRFHSKLQY